MRALARAGGTNRLLLCAISGLVLLGIGACGKSEPKSQPASASQAGTAAPSTPAAPPDNNEAVATTNATFTQPIVLSLNTDAYDSANQLQQLNGVDPKDTNGAAYELTGSSGCLANAVPTGGLSLTLGLDDATVIAWLEHEQLLSMSTYTITYSHARFPGYGTSNTFNCLVLSEALRKYLPDDRKGADIHHTVALVFAYRVFDSWTYKNRYGTGDPGQGGEKVFAGTFAYHLQSPLPGVSFTGPGTAEVKTHLNPDTGQWVSDTFELHDPSVIFER